MTFSCIFIVIIVDPCEARVHGLVKNKGGIGVIYNPKIQCIWVQSCHAPSHF